MSDDDLVWPLLRESGMKGKNSRVQGASHASQRDRLAKIEGQIRGVIRMIDERRYCLDILNQIKSMQSALGVVRRDILGEHLRVCVERAVESGSNSEMRQHLKELDELLKRG